MRLRRSHHGPFIPVLLLCLVLVATACSTSVEDPGPSATETDGEADDEQTEAAGDSDDESFDLRIGQSSEIPALDPQLRDSGALRAVLYGNVFEGLVTFSGAESGEPVPVLATDWESVDETTWRFNLVEGATFHNGEPFNADAAVYSIERFLDPDRGSEISGYAETIAGVTAVDENTIEITTAEADSQLVRRMTWIMMVPPEHSEAADLADEPIGTGPFQFVERDVNDIHVAAWDDYRDGRPATDTAVYRTISEPGARLAGLEAGELDIITELPVDSRDRAPKVESASGFEVAALRPNALGGLMENRDLREAVALAINIDALREALWGDFASSSSGNLVPASVTGFNPDLSDFPHDPDRARQIIEDAGATGETVRIAVPAGRYPRFDDASEVIAADLQAVGLAPEIQIMPDEDWLDAILTSSPESAELTLTGVGSEDFRSALQPFLTYLTPDAAAGAPPTDEYPQFSELIGSASQEFDEAEQERILQEVSALVYESAAMIPLYAFDAIYGAAEGISWEVRGDNRIELATVTRS